MPDYNRKGVLLFIVLGTLIVVATLSTVILRIISNQASFTHHHASRIQAQYAAKAGAIYALEMLRINDGNWSAAGASYTRYMYRSGASSPDFNEPSLPSSVNFVQIKVYPSYLAVPGQCKIESKADYTYTAL